MRSGPVPEVWTRQEFVFTAEQVDSHQHGSYGVPEAMVPAIANAVLDTLAEFRIDPERVYLSGHDGLEADPDEAKRSGYTDEDQPLSLRDMLEDLEEEEEQDAVRYSQRRQSQSEAGASALPVYHMSAASKLYDSAAAHTNPIHHAGMSHRSTIVVYDKSRIMDWGKGRAFSCLNDEPYGVSIEATAAELVVTILVNIRLRYRIEGYPYEAPELRSS